jgi:hypothetical protein
MRKLLLGAAAAASLAAIAVPAVAQPWQGYRHDDAPYGRQISSGYVDSLEWRINNAARDRRISWGEARQLRNELRQIQGPLVYRVETGQASRWESRRLMQVVSRIENAVDGY